MAIAIAPFRDDTTLKAYACLSLSKVESDKLTVGVFSVVIER